MAPRPTHGTRRGAPSRRAGGVRGREARREREAHLRIHGAVEERAAGGQRHLDEPGHRGPAVGVVGIDAPGAQGHPRALHHSRARGDDREGGAHPPEPSEQQSGGRGREAREGHRVDEQVPLRQLGEQAGGEESGEERPAEGERARGPAAPARGGERGHERQPQGPHGPTGQRGAQHAGVGPEGGADAPFAELGRLGKAVARGAGARRLHRGREGLPDLVERELPLLEHERVGRRHRNHGEASLQGRRQGGAGRKEHDGQPGPARPARAHRRECRRDSHRAGAADVDGEGEPSREAAGEGEGGVARAGGGRAEGEGEAHAEGEGGVIRRPLRGGEERGGEERQPGGRHGGPGAGEEPGEHGGEEQAARHRAERERLGGGLVAPRLAEGGHEPGVQRQPEARVVDGDAVRDLPAGGEVLVPVGAVGRRRRSRSAHRGEEARHGPEAGRHPHELPPPCHRRRLPWGVLRRGAGRRLAARVDAVARREQASAPGGLQMMARLISSFRALRARPPRPAAALGPALGVPAPVGAPNLVLYKFDACPYCQLVMREAASLGIVLPMRDTRADPAAAADHRAATGRTQVPALYIDGKPLFESADIVEWLRVYARREAPSAG